MMKTKVYLSLIVSLMTYTFVFSQQQAETWIFESPQPTQGIQHYQASKQISLMPGFASSPSNGSYFKAEIDPFLIVPGFNNNITGGTSDNNNGGAVGTLPITINVNDYGSSQLDLPIHLPPGIASLTPELSFTYNSLNGDGIMGVGWTIGGLSKISRVPKSYYYNGVTGEAGFGASSQLTLDGVYLIAAGNGTYYPELQDFSVIKAIEASNIELGFKVLKANGLVYEYGGTENSRHYLQALTNPIAWYLSRISDAFGNYIEFAYVNDKSSGSFYPDYIRYTGNTQKATAPMYEVKFIYYDNNRLDTQKKYFSDELTNSPFYSQITKLLKGVDVRYIPDDDLVVRYFPYYSNGGIIPKTLLIAIEPWHNETNHASTLNPVWIEWENSAYDLSTKTLPNGLPFLSFPEETIQRGIFAAHFKDKNTTDMVHFGINTSGSGRYLHIYENLSRKYEGGLLYNFANPIKLVQNEGIVKTLSICDSDGDGIDEIVSVHRNGAEALLTLIKVNLDSYPNFSENLIQNVTGLWPLNNDDHNLFSDFNSDGLTDVAYIANNGVNDIFKGFFLSKPGFPFSEQISGDQINIGNVKKVFVGDFRGAGQNQMLIITSDTTRILFLNGNTEPSILNVTNDFSQIYNTGIFVNGDFNGDGKTDMLLLKNGTNQNWIFYLGNGNGSFNTPDTLTNDPVAGTSFERITADLNNDGFTDICHVDFDIVTIGDREYKRFYRTDYIIRADAGNGGIKIVKKEMKDANGIRIPIDEVKIYTNNHWQYFHHCIGNFTGSSPSQIMFGRVYPDPDQYGVVRFKPTVTGPLNTPFLQAVKKITDGLGAISFFEYTPHTYQNYASAKSNSDESINKYTYPIQKFRSFLNVVTKWNMETSQDVYKSVLFNFYNPVLHGLGKGLLGFERTTKLDLISATILVNEYDFGNNYYNKSIVSSSLFSNASKVASLIEKTAFETDYRNFRELGYKIFYPYFSKVTKQFFELDSEKAYKIELTTMDIPNQYGNHQNVTFEYYSSSKVLPYKITRTTTYDNFTNANRRFIGLIKKEITDYNLGEDNEHTIRTVDYVNDSTTGYRGKKIVEQGSNKVLTETYTPDDFGNTISVEQATQGFPTRTTNIVFTPDGRFPQNVTNADGHLIVYDYYLTSGRLKSETDANGRQTKFFYDFFGDLTKTIRPDSTQTVSVKRWVKPSSPHPDEPQHGNPIYFTLSRSSGENEVCTFFDQNNRSLREVRVNFSGQKIYKDFHYYEDHKYATGLLYKETLPYIDEGIKPEFITFAYDFLRRKRLTINPNGSFEEITRNGLTQQIKQFDGQSKEIVQTEGGLVDYIIDNGSNTVDYQYYGDGKVKKTFQAGIESTAVVYTYDIHRNLSSIQDPALGLLSYDYNAFGDLLYKLDFNSNTFYEYDKLSRLISRIGSDGVATFTWDTRQNGIGLPATSTYQPSNVNFPVVSETYEYDQFGRLSETKQSVGGNELYFRYKYDVLGRRKTITYPSGVMLTNMYDEYGTLRYIVDKARKKLWQYEASDAFQNITQYTLGGNIQVVNNYGQTDGLIRSIRALDNKSDHFNFNLEYDWYGNGNLLYRKDLTRNLSEEFTYDSYNRLKTINLNQSNPINSVTYKENGNIETKVDAGAYSYSVPYKPYAVSTIVPVPGSFPSNTQNVTHTGFNKVEMITEGDYTLTLNYGPNQERVLQNKSGLLHGSQQQIRYFTPLYEVVNEGGSQKLIHYFMSPIGIFAIFTIENQIEGHVNYVLKDHQGSLAALLNDKGQGEYFSFDAWGRRRNAQTWTYTNMPVSFGTTRGFTMHEHLDEFKLINMKGRVYDPLVGRFLSADPFIQQPDYSQSYNRYSYAFNNPLRFSDPSGFFAEGDSTLSPSRASLHLPFLPAQRLSYRPGASTNTDNTSLGIVFKETETALPAPYLNSKLSRDAEGNAEMPTRQEDVKFNQTRLWYQFGGGTRMEVDLNSIDLGKVRMSDFNSRGLATVRLDGQHFSNLNDALVHGTITLQRIGNTNHARVALNSDPTTPQINGQPAGMYNFTMHAWGEPISWIRNPVTYMGGIINGLMPIGGTFIYVGGDPFPIYYNGTATIQR